MSGNVGTCPALGFSGLAGGNARRAHLWRYLAALVLARGNAAAFDTATR